jgi:hypothetical protein
MKKTDLRLPRGLIAAALACLLLPACDEVPLSGDSTVEVCNFDDEEYLVRLYSRAGVAVDEFELGEAFDISDRCDEFKDLPAGNYYLAIYEDGDDEATDTSEDFYLDGEDELEFVIDSSGDIEEE